MTPKEHRDLLFKTGRPYIRPIELIRDDAVGKDMGVLWGAYKRDSFEDMPELAQAEFADFMLDLAANYTMGWIIEDKNSQFKDGFGPIGMVMAVYNGWELEPHFEPFSWASPRNILRATVSFFQMMRYDKSIGIVNVYSLNRDKRFFKHVTHYGVLRYLGCIPHGDVRGDRHIFFVRGRGNERRSQHG